jgi:DNA-binding HxlR family transcriptional regulator
LQRAIQSITAKLLSKELKSLAPNYLEVKKVYDSSLQIVEYRLSDYGKTLRKIKSELRNWRMLH